MLGFTLVFLMWSEQSELQGLFVGIDLMLSGGNLHAPQDSHESKELAAAKQA